jgi:hypothetical protein
MIPMSAVTAMPGVAGILAMATRDVVTNLPGMTLPPTRSGLIVPRVVVLMMVGALAGHSAVASVLVCMAGCARGMVRVVGHWVTSSEGCC